jgi:hypothetical protein
MSLPKGLLDSLLYSLSDVYYLIESSVNVFRVLALQLAPIHTVVKEGTGAGLVTSMVFI